MHVLQVLLAALRGYQNLLHDLGYRRLCRLRFRVLGCLRFFCGGGCGRLQSKDGLCSHYRRAGR
jgi:hypothetical protein